MKNGCGAFVLSLVLSGLVQIPEIANAAEWCQNVCQ